MTQQSHWLIKQTEVIYRINKSSGFPYKTRSSSVPAANRKRNTEAEGFPGAAEAGGKEP